MHRSTKDNKGERHPRREFLRRTLAMSPLFAGARALGESSGLPGLSLQEASERVRKKTASPVELTRACLERIEGLNSRLNAFITVIAEQALAQAGELEDELQRGKWRGPLHGIPIALKDLIDTAGVRTTAASARFAERVPAEDAEVVRRLKAAGAILLGKLNMDEFAYSFTSETSHFGPIHNPWKLDRTPGGSSGGSGVAVAAQLCYGALGSDTGGSIRLPAAYCGIVGLKPTYGLVSARGVLPLAWSLDHLGPMCRTVVDTALLLQAMAGHDPRDSTSLNTSLPDYSEALGAKTTALRLGMPRALFYSQLHPEIEAVVERALEVLSRLTAGIREVELPPIGRLPVLIAEAYTYHEPHLEQAGHLYHRRTLGSIQNGARVTMPDYVRARRKLDQLRRRVEDVFESVDLLVTPTTPQPPIKLEEGREPDLVLLRNAIPFNIYDLPTISVPCGFTREGLPVGLQISGPRLGEPQVLALAHAYQQATDWHHRHPDL